MPLPTDAEQLSSSGLQHSYRSGNKKDFLTNIQVEHSC